MSGEIIKVIDNLASRFGIAIDWTSQNVIPYLEELMKRYIKYDITMSIILIIFLLILTFILFKIFFKIYKQYKKELEKDRWYDGMWFLGFVVAGIVLAIVVILTLICIPIEVNSIIQNIYIPELTIIEKIQSLMLEV